MFLARACADRCHSRGPRKNTSRPRFSSRARSRFSEPHVLLLEDDLAAVVGDLGSAPLPFDLIERRDVGVAKEPFEMQPDALRFTHAIFATVPGFARLGKRGRANTGFELDHGER